VNLFEVILSCLQVILNDVDSSLQPVHYRQMVTPNIYYNMKYI